MHMSEKARCDKRGMRSDVSEFSIQNMIMLSPEQDKIPTCLEHPASLDSSINTSRLLGF